jgi:hypothetical protein
MYMEILTNFQLEYVLLLILTNGDESCSLRYKTTVDDRSTVQRDNVLYSYINFPRIRCTHMFQQCNTCYDMACQLVSFCLFSIYQWLEYYSRVRQHGNWNSVIGIRS